MTLPSSILIASPITANEARAVIAAGAPPGVFGTDEDERLIPDRMQALVWVALRRAGHLPSWEDAGDVVLVFPR